MLGVDLADVTLRQQDEPVLDRISLHLTAGRVHGLLGPTGAGKSALLSVIAGYLPPTSGTVLIGGRPLTAEGVLTDQVDLVRSGTFPSGSGLVADALTFTASVRPHWSGDFAQRLRHRFGLPLERPLSQLSEGERSAVRAILNLAARTPVTLLDECCTGMDAHMRDVFLDELLADLMAQPRTLVIATHLIDEIGPLFDDVIVLDRGAVAYHEPVDSLGRQGTSVIGPSYRVDAFVDGLAVVDEQELGPTKSVAVNGALTPAQRDRAFSQGLDLAPIGMRQLLPHLVQGQGGT